MITLKFGIQYENPHDREIVGAWSLAFSDMYRHICKNIELNKDKNFEKACRDKYTTLCSHTYLSAVVKAEGTRGSWEAKQKEGAKQIEALEKDIERLHKEATDVKITPKRKKIVSRILYKLQKRLARKRRDQGKGAVFGSRKVLQAYNKLLNQGRKEEARGKLAEYRSRRDSGYYSDGEALDYGNRKFNLRTISNLTVTFKPRRGTSVRLKLLTHSKRYLKILPLIEHAARENLQPFSILLTKEHLCITVDEEKLLGIAFDKKGYCAARKGLEDEERKETFKAFKKEQESRVQATHGSLTTRTLAVDMNPERLGFCVLEASHGGKSFKVLKRWGYEYKRLASKRTSPGRRTQQLAIFWRDAFAVARHYRCAWCSIEDLDFKRGQGLEGSKESNRLTRNVWQEEKQSQWVDRLCSFSGMVRVPVNPVYTSFVGNLQYKEWDPVASAIEIGRRGLVMKKVLDDTWYPEVSTLLQSDRLYGLQIGGGAPEVRSLRDLYQVVKGSGLRYRRPTSDSGFIESIYKKRGYVLLH